MANNLLLFLSQAAPDEMEGQLDNGLIIGHAYSITDVRYVGVLLDDPIINHRTRLQHH